MISNQQQSLLVCDIGGTNSRFAIFNHNNDILTKQQEIWLKSNDYQSFDNLLTDLATKNSNFNVNNFAKCVLAIPGPITTSPLVELVHIRWSIDKENLSKLFPNTNFAFINDFIAQAFGFLTPKRDDTISITGPRHSECPDLAVVGAGTGLGHSGLKFIADKIIALPSEAGHAAFPFTGRVEQKYQQFITEQTGTIQPGGNLVVSGQGLAHLHQFLTGRKLTPQEVSAEISAGDETSHYFAKFFARCCRNYCLTVLPAGGNLFVSGGVVAKNQHIVCNESFRLEFINCPEKDYILKAIKISLNINEQIGLWGAAQYGTIYL